MELFGRCGVHYAFAFFLLLAARHAVFALVDPCLVFFLFREVEFAENAVFFLVVDEAQREFAAFFIYPQVFDALGQLCPIKRAHADAMAQ